MPGHEVFEPSRAATALGVVLLPLIAIGLLIAGIVALVGSDGALSVVIFVAFVLLAVLAAAPAFLLIRGWFALEVDPTALSLVGLFGLGRVRLPWNDLDGVGIVRWRGARVLTVQPRDAVPARANTVALKWDAPRKLLLISGVERWSRPTDELLAAVQRYAGEKWHDQLAEPIPE